MTESKSAAQRFYDRIAASYDALSDASEHDVRNQGLDLLAAAPGEVVLEIGFGTGHALCRLAADVGPTGRVLGVDISPKMRELAWQRVQDAGHADRVELDVATVPPLPFGDASCDAVFASFTLELFPLETIPVVLGEVRRVLCPGGRVGIVAMATVPEGERESLLENTYRWFHHHFPHIVDCQPIDAAAHLRAAGFTVVDRVDAEIWTMPVVALVARVATPGDGTHA